jgi:hypothetical protein
MKFAVTCPECALESISELSIAAIANALLTGRTIRLYAACHDQFWTATFVEREQLRKALAVLPVKTPHTSDIQPHAQRDAQLHDPHTSIACRNSG